MTSPNATSSDSVSCSNILQVSADICHGLLSWSDSKVSSLTSLLEMPSSHSTPQTVAKVALAGATFTIAYTYYYSRVQIAKWERALTEKGAKPPGPKPLPILGNMLALRRAYYKTLYEHVGEPASVFWVLWNPFVVVNQEDGLRRVLGGAAGLYTKPRYFGYRSRAVASAVDAQRDNVAQESIAYEPNGDVSRRALHVMVGLSLPIIKRRVHALLRAIENATDEHGGDVTHIIRRAVVSLNLRLLFGARDEDADRIACMIAYAGDEFARRMVNPVRVLYAWVANVRYFGDVGRLIALGRRLCRSLDEIAARKEGKPAGVSWVHAWIGKVGVIGKLGKVVGLLMASTQTVPLTAVWLLHLVAGDTAVRQRLRAELIENGIHSITDLDYARMDSLVYTDAVIKETLRLYPPFPLMQRQAQRDDVLCGIRIPEKTIVYVVPWLVHRNERFWPNPHTFAPERFLGDDTRSDWLFLPFGRGSRMCAGARLALTELKVLLVHAVLGFEWTSERDIGEQGDERFPDLGMVPTGVRIAMRSSNKTQALDEILAASDCDP